MSSKLEWNSLFARVVNDTLCFAWQDNNIVLALSTIHTIHTANDFIKRQRKRPAKTSTNGRIVRLVFGNDPKKELEIPIFIDDYNHFMGGVDIANQYREAYETHRPTCRNWWPLFYWLIDVSVINSYRLYCLHMTDMGRKALSHVQFRTELYCYLFGFSVNAKVQRLQLNLGTKRLFSSNVPHIHERVRRPRIRDCEWCSYLLRYTRFMGGQETPRRRSNYGCRFCEVTLCDNNECWTRFHRWEAI